jgi:hypothetical protein
MEAGRQDQTDDNVEKTLLPYLFKNVGYVTIYKYYDYHIYSRMLVMLLYINIMKHLLSETCNSNLKHLLFHINTRIDICIVSCKHQ